MPDHHVELEQLVLRVPTRRIERQRLLQYPDGTRSSALTVTPADPDVTFIIDEAAARQGASGWVITVVNASASGQGDGSVKLKSCKLG